MFTRGEANLVVDESPHNLAYNFASAEEEPLPLSSIGSGFIYANIIPDELEPSTKIEEIVDMMAVYDDVNVSTVSATARWSCPLDKQCVRFAEKKMNRVFDTDARNIKSNKKDPCINCGVLLRSSNPYGHIAVIIKVESSSFEVIEQNQLGCGIISTRSIEVGDSLIRGFVE